MADIAVINASSLIFLARGGHMELLPHFFSRVLVPSAVADEILVRGHEDVTAQALRETPWIESVEAATIPATIAAWGLGAGESAVLALARAVPGSEAVMDDLVGRRCAASLDIPVRGTLGLVLLANSSM